MSSAKRKKPAPHAPTGKLKGPAPSVPNDRHTSLPDGKIEIRCNEPSKAEPHPCYDAIEQDDNAKTSSHHHPPTTSDIRSMDYGSILLKQRKHYDYQMHPAFVSSCEEDRRNHNVIDRKKTNEIVGTFSKAKPVDHQQQQSDYAGTFQSGLGYLP